MSDQEEIKLFGRIHQSIVSAQKRMLERKMKLGEQVVIADADGRPVTVTAEEAMKFFQSAQ